MCVLTGHQLLSKSELESKIVENGGLTVQHPGMIFIPKIIT